MIDPTIKAARIVYQLQRRGVTVEVVPRSAMIRDGAPVLGIYQTEAKTIQLQAGMDPMLHLGVLVHEAAHYLLVTEADDCSEKSALAVVTVVAMIWGVDPRGIPQWRDVRELCGRPVKRATRKLVTWGNRGVY